MGHAKEKETVWSVGSGSTLEAKEQAAKGW